MKKFIGFGIGSVVAIFFTWLGGMAVQYSVYIR